MSRGQPFLGLGLDARARRSRGRCPCARRTFVACAVAVVCTLSVACESCDERDPAAAPSSNTAVAPVAAPKGHLADIWLPQPKALLGRLRPKLAGLAVPKNVELFFAEAAELPAVAADGFASDVPLIAAAFATDHVFVVFALPLTSPADFVARATSGAAATHRAKPLHGMTQLVPLAAGSSRPLFVRGRYLLLSERPEDARFAANYLAAGLARRRVPVSDGVVVQLPERALAGPASRLLEETWRSSKAWLTAAQRRESDRHAGRAPDFGDPAAAVAGLGRGVMALKGLLESTKELELRLEPGDGRVLIDARLLPEKTGVLAELLADSASGDTTSLLAVAPESTVIALFRSTREGRERTGKEIASQLEGLLGERLGRGGAELIETTLSRFALGRGDELLLALDLDPVPAMLLRCTVDDRERLDAALEGLLEMPKVPALAAPASALLGPIDVGPVHRNAAGGSAPLTVGPAGARQHLELEWKYSERYLELRLGLGSRQTPALRSRQSPASATSLGDALRRHSPAEAVVALRVVAASADRDAGTGESWALLSLGKSDGRGVVKAEAPEELLISLARRWVFGVPEQRP